MTNTITTNEAAIKAAFKKYHEFYLAGGCDNTLIDESTSDEYAEDVTSFFLELLSEGAQ